jgi:AraC-like DNA-binding protein
VSFETSDHPLAPSSHPGWVSARLVQSAMLFLASRGVSVQTCLQATHIDAQSLQDPDGRVPLADVERLLRVVQADHQDLNLGSLGLAMARSISAASFGVLGHLFMASSTLGELMQTLVRYNGLMSSFGRSELRHGPGTVTLSWRAQGGVGPALQHLGAEFVLGASREISKVLAPRLPPPLVVRFQHAELDASGRDALSQHFECPVHLGQADNAIVMPLAWLQLRLPHGDQELATLLHQRAQHLLAARSQQACVVAEARRHIALAMPKGTPNRLEVARRLGCSESTLHRRLQEQGTTFQLLVDAQRLSQAQDALARGELSASSVSQRLGFSSPQVFSRWFRQQTGFTPGQYREQAAAEA